MNALWKKEESNPHKNLVQISFQENIFNTIQKYIHNIVKLHISLKLWIILHV